LFWLEFQVVQYFCRLVRTLWILPHFIWWVGSLLQLPIFLNERYTIELLKLKWGGGLFLLGNGNRVSLTIFKQILWSSISQQALYIFLSTYAIATLYLIILDKKRERQAERWRDYCS